MQRQNPFRKSMAYWTEFQETKLDLCMNLHVFLGEKIDITICRCAWHISKFYNKCFINWSTRRCSWFTSFRWNLKLKWLFLFFGLSTGSYSVELLNLTCNVIYHTQSVLRQFTSYGSFSSSLTKVFGCFSEQILSSVSVINGVICPNKL